MLCSLIFDDVFVTAMDNDQADNGEEQAQAGNPENAGHLNVSECFHKLWSALVPVGCNDNFSLIDYRFIEDVMVVMAVGLLPPAAVKEIQDMLQKERARLPAKFGQLEALDAMTQNPPTLSKLARNKIRDQMRECGKLSNENIMKLELSRAMIESVLLEDLGIDREVMKKIMEGAEELMRRMSAERAQNGPGARFNTL